ncbi:MAG TPA: thioredoxin family protein [Verrucomicrobiae bacterium]|nr:thioredoxin family protein [Verrucomicrobiae bacterium]
MKKLFIALLASAALYQAAAAEGEWLTDFTKATQKAKAENKLVLMDFTGSDWCPPCKALYKNVLSSAEFVEYAKSNLILVEVDFPTSKKQSEELKKANEALQTKFNVDGYPTIIVLDSNGKELSRDSGYAGEKPKEFIAKIEALKKK